MLQKIDNFLFLTLPELLANLCSKMPIVGPVFCFPYDILEKALFKIFFLWMLSSMPVILSIVGGMVAGDTFTYLIEQNFNIKIVFIYTTAFISPLLYMIVSRLLYPGKEDIFNGAGGLLLVAFIIFAFTAWTYGNNSFEGLADEAKPTLNTLSYVVYGFSVYLWFLTLADELLDGEYVRKKTQKNLNAFVSEYADHRKE